MSSARIAAEIRARIEAGQLKPGARVPSARQIMRKWGVANATASKALAILIDAGLVRAIPGVGTVVEQGLSQARIVRAGLAIADREGLAAVTIRRVASELRASPMALYRYFPNKEELVLLLADAVFAEHAPPAPLVSVDLRLQLEAAARCQWQVYVAHPWLAAAVSMSRPQLVPHGMLHTEHVLRLLDGLGLSDETMMLAAISLMGYVRGVALNLESELQAEQETGLSRDAYLERQTTAFHQVVVRHPMPTLGRIGGQPELDLRIERQFEFGLARMLDGLLAFVKAPVRARAR
jgi:AcrR family transcriptional regulator